MHKRKELEQTVLTLEALRPALGDVALDPTIKAIYNVLSKLPPDLEQRKQLTILFADVSGFTSMSERMAVDDVKYVMQSLWGQVDPVVASHGGMLIKRIGDALMALWGVESAREDDPECAIHAALAMQEKVNEFVVPALLDRARDAPGDAVPQLKMRIGINTGLVILYTDEITGKPDAVGDPVNVAQRMEQAAPVGGILITHDTYSRVRGVFDVQAREVSAKGKSNPVQAYVVERAKPRAFRRGARGVEGVETPMVGREAELVCLTEALQTTLADRELQVVTVFGEAGMGKSRLLYEFKDYVDVMPTPVLAFNGRATESRRGQPFSLIRDVFSFRFEIQDSDAPAVACRKLEEGMCTFFDDKEMATVVAHFIGHLIGLDFSWSTHLSGVAGDAKLIRDRAFQRTPEFFQTVTRETAAILYLEDLHWADDNSLEFVEHLTRTCTKMPLMVVCMARPSLLDRRPGWGVGERWHTSVKLEPLTRPKSRKLVNEILRKVPNVPAKIRDMVVDNADGNPFYVEEVIKVLIDQGVIVPGEQEWGVDESQLTAGVVPPGATGVLQARLDALPPREKEVLQRASVLGRMFWDGALERLGGAHAGANGGGVGEETRAALASLCQKELIYSRRGATAFEGTSEYVFKHALLLQVTYESVLRRELREYHRRAAEWLTEHSGERVGEYAAVIAHHYERAQDHSLAADWYGRAAKRAYETYAPETSVAHYRKALGLLPAAEGDDARRALRAEWYEKLGEVLWKQKQSPKAAEAYRCMLAEAEAARDPSAQSHACNRLAWVQERQGDFRAALESARRAEALAREAGAHPSARNELAHALSRQGRALHRLGDIPKGLSLSSQALALFGEIGDQKKVSKMLNSLGEIERLRGDYAAARDFYQKALNIARDIGQRSVVLRSLSNLGGTLAGMEEYAAAEAHLKEAIKMARAAEDLWIPSETYRFLAEACLGRGKIAEALEAARAALTVGREMGDREHVGGAWRALGLVASSAGAAVNVCERDYTAGECFAESLRTFEELGEEHERARTLRDWARHERAHGDQRRGREMWQEAHAVFTRLGMKLPVERMADEA